MFVTHAPTNSTTPDPGVGNSSLGLIGLGVFIFICLVCFTIFCRAFAKCMKSCCEFCSDCTKAMKRCCSGVSRRLCTGCRNCFCDRSCLTNSVNVLIPSNQTRSSAPPDDFRSPSVTPTSPPPIDWNSVLPAYVDAAAPPPTYSFAMRDMSVYIAPPPESPTNMPPPDYEEATRYHQNPADP
ncbi:uncharacterized protein LOC127845569 [Dreissena polymorpha]|uniref:Uncharacterized protein n=1 Tax=Dreissena polymorpha TaxID=45954 RepID=A0A9D4IB26_DREPO|nr:uncharacterized protein LOC127845569 [Dreissena polymorpha]KAH3768696.1 hypothetical protein DPMN_169915 [Dreissena polymorpha]